MQYRLTATAIDRLVMLFVLLSSASFIIRTGLFSSSILIPYGIPVFELCISISVLLVVIRTCTYGANKDLLLVLKKYGKFIALFTALLILGTVFGWLSYNPDTSALLPTIKDFALFFIASCAFLLNIHYGRSEKFREQSLLAMSSFLLLFIFILLPSLALQLGLLHENAYFLAFHRNTNILGTLLLIPFVVFFNKTIVSSSSTVRAISAALSIFSFSFIFWTGSRGAWLIAGTAIFTTIILKAWESHSFLGKIKKVILNGIVALCIVCIAFIMLNPAAKIMVLDRVFPQITNNTPTTKNFENTSTRKAIKVIGISFTEKKSVSLSSIPYQDRQRQWPDALALIKKHPEGIGPQYPLITKSIFTIDRWTAAHNSLLQATLTGGILLLILVLYGIYYLLKTLWHMPRGDNERIVLFSLLIGFILALQFNDFLFILPWIWVVAGLIIGKKLNRTDIR